MKTFFKKYKFWLIVLFVITIALIIDLVTKIAFYEKNHMLIDGFISIYYTFNTGAAWSILANQTTLLIVVSVFILIALTIFSLYYKSSSAFYSVAVGLIYGGAIGNLIDRIFLGGVRDFIRLEFWQSFPIFNIADCCLTIGAVLLCVFFIFFSSKIVRKQPASGINNTLEKVPEEKENGVRKNTDLD